MSTNDTNANGVVFALFVLFVSFVYWYVYLKNRPYKYACVCKPTRMDDIMVYRGATILAAQTLARPLFSSKLGLVSDVNACKTIVACFEKKAKNAPVRRRVRYFFGILFIQVLGLHYGNITVKG